VHGAVGISHALHEVAKQLGAEPPLALAQQLEGLVRRWRGISQSVQASERSAARVRPPAMADLPAWIHPEHVLPAGHPLLTLRLRMEKDLVRQDPGWARRSSGEQCTARQAWLAAHEEQLAGAMAGLEFGRFDVLGHWLAGGSPRRSAP